MIYILLKYKFNLILGNCSDSCSNRIHVDTFDHTKTRFAGDYNLVTEEDAIKKNWSSHLTNGRDTYRSVENPKECIYWHPLGHWWVGNCDMRGVNKGEAYLQPDKTCPYDGATKEWKRGGSDQVLEKFQVTEGTGKSLEKLE